MVALLLLDFSAVFVFIDHSTLLKCLECYFWHQRKGTNLGNVPHQQKSCSVVWPLIERYHIHVFTLV